MKCKHQRCRCEVPADSGRLGNGLPVTEEEIDFNPYDKAASSSADANDSDYVRTRQYCCSHCAEVAANSSQSCGCGHEECSQKEAIFTTQAEDVQQGLKDK